MEKKKKENRDKGRPSETVAGLSEKQQAELSQAFGFHNLYPHQSAAIAAMAGSSDLLLLAGTSRGKTEAVLGSNILHPERGLTLLIEPLRALQSDMLHRLKKLQLNAVVLNSDLSTTAFDAALVDIKAGRISHVLTTPEQLEKNIVFQALDSAGVATVIIDEVHCLLDYGGDFRPSYNRIGIFVRHLRQRPVVAACTATLAPDSIKKVEKFLSMKEPILIREPTDRPEIRQNIVEIGSELTCKQKDMVEKERFRRMKSVIKHTIKKGDAVIVYCNTVKQTVDVTKNLKDKGYRAAPFYADLPTKEKENVLRNFQSEKPPIIVATSAFGLGIDKPNVRLVVHMSMPLSIEDYWQKTGRAGRDGRKSYSYLFWFHGDYQTNQHIIKQNSNKLRKLKQLLEFLQSSECCVQKLRRYFGEDAGEKCEHCSWCKHTN